MKTFRYELGHVAGATMTVAELRDLLATYPDDMPVFATWEGVLAYVAPSSVSVAQVSKGMEADACDGLVIDVNGY
jgi:hypothetical protein